MGRVGQKVAERKELIPKRQIQPDIAVAVNIMTGDIIKPEIIVLITNHEAEFVVKIVII